MNRTMHRKILSVLEKRALQYKNTDVERVNDRLAKIKLDKIDETGMVETLGLTDDNSIDTKGPSKEVRSAREVELEQVCGVDKYLLKVHGIAPGLKPEGVWRPIYEKLNEIWLRLLGNDKLEKVLGIIDDTGRQK